MLRKPRVRKELIFLLLLALSFVPVFQAAHMLTHVTTGDVVGVVQVDGDLEDSEGETDADSGIDKICLDCLALTAFSVILPILAFFFFGQMRSQLLAHSKSRRILLNFSSPYLTRAPPRS